MTEPAMMKGIPGTREEGRKRLVLIVEDDFVNREILKANLEAEYEIDPEEFLSMGKATPFAGQRVYGRCLRTVHAGREVYKPSTIMNYEL